MGNFIFFEGEEYFKCLVECGKRDNFLNKFRILWEMVRFF